MIEIIEDEKYCEGKMCYSKTRAEKASHACMKRRNRKLRVYPCPHCNYYHLTSKKFETNIY